MATLPMPAWSPEDVSFAPPPSKPLPTPVASPARFSALEWSIVAMAERDPVSSLREPGRFLSALRSLFGIRRVTRLANDRLEALRRIAVHAWRYHWDVPASEIRDFVAAGYSLDHYELVQLSIGKARAEHRRSKRR